MPNQTNLFVLPFLSSCIDLFNSSVEQFADGFQVKDIFALIPNAMDLAGVTNAELLEDWQTLTPEESVSIQSKLVEKHGKNINPLVFTFTNLILTSGNIVAHFKENPLGNHKSDN